MKGKSSLKDVVRDMVKIDKKIPKCVSIRAGGKLYLGHPDDSGFLFLETTFWTTACDTDLLLLTGLNV